MIDLRIKYNGVRVRVRGFTQRKLINIRLLEIGLDSMKERLSLGVGSDDAPTKPLSRSYARRKAKITRHKAIRDLRLTGKFLDTFQPRYSDDDRATANSGGRDGRLKAILYRDLINFSTTDQRRMSDAAGKWFREQTTQVFEPLTGGGKVKNARFVRTALFGRNTSFARAA